MLGATFAFLGQAASGAPEVENFEIVVPWGLDHPRGKIIASMIGNHSTLGTKYNYTYTQVGGGPNDRKALVSRFLAGDYPDLAIITQDWYSEFIDFGIFYNFADDIGAWEGDRANWRTDIPSGWWDILDKENGDGTGSSIYALPFYSQSIMPYANVEHLTAVGVDYETDLETIDDFLAACEKLDAGGYTPFALVGKLQSDIAYMNYMLGHTNNYIDSHTDPATVIPWDSDGKYGVNGSLSVEGFAAYLKLKGEGWVKSTVDTDGGGEANSIFEAGNASFVFCGPWGTGIFEKDALGVGLDAEDFKCIPMWKNSDGSQSTSTGGGIAMVPSASAFKGDAATLAQWLLDDENQMKTVSNWLNQAWRIPVRDNIADFATWVAASPENRTNFQVHVESQAYAYPWGRQHPQWIDIHESVMMPGYYNALLEVEYDKGYTDAEYTAMAQEALDAMAQNIQAFYLGEKPAPSGTPGFEAIHVLLLLGFLGGFMLFRRRR
jgi:maltose-binding protein MalE